VISFNPEARREYLRGFSERKRQRRAFGLAMQKVKDRKAKLEDRREQRKEQLERVEEAEQQKRSLLETVLGRPLEDTAIPGASYQDDRSKGKKSEIKTYQDKATEKQWGGQVIVTTTYANLVDNSDDEDTEKTKEKRKYSNDEQQRAAGDVTKFLTELKGTLPGKKSSGGKKPHKGQHGAATMKGIGGAKNLKMAQKVLSRMEAKTTKGPGRDGKKRKR